MKAIVMTAAGGPEVLKLRDLPIPDLPSRHHIRVRLHAAGVNPVDAKMRASGTYYPERLPAVLGCDGAGVVDVVGDEVQRFGVGDEVFFFQGGIGNEQGNYAEYTVVHEEYVAARPDSLSLTDAAAVPLVLITAWESLRDRANVQPGHHVLVHAGAGGVGHVAVQLARNLGARVACTVPPGDKTDLAQELGAGQCIDYRQTDFVQAARDWTGGGGVDMVLDTVGGDVFCRSFDATRVYGDVVTLLQTECEAKAMKAARLRNLRISYELMLTPMHLGMHNARVHQRRILEKGAGLIDAGKLRIVVRDVFPLEEVAWAHERVESGHSTGKLVLTIA